MRVAIFDFDGTLYKKETFSILMTHLKKHPIYKRNYKAFIQTVLPRYIGVKLKIYPHSKMQFHSMQAYVAALDRLNTDDLNVYFSEVAQSMRPDFNPTVIERFRKHQADGVHLMLVSGAYTPLLVQFIEEFPFDTMIGTTIPMLKNEVNKTEYLDHVHGKRKNEKIYEALMNQDIDWDNSYAYADSYSDLSTLKLVGHPVVVDPDNKLQKHAEKNDWEII